MLISLNWLKDYINLDENIDIKELENALTMIGQEVENIELQGENLKNILTSKILELKMHPDSDHLTVCQVDNGSFVSQVVCGASNHKEGDIVAMAQVGAKLSEDFVIKKGKIRGIESNGMLCSETELGVGNDNSGIIIFPKDTKLGIPLNEYYNLNDTVFELEITPNRPDCLSHIGIARELSAYYNTELKLPKINNHKVSEELIDINIKDNLSKRYMARVIKNVKVGPSPKWLITRLASMGIRSINNLVDISNFVMIETNQPNHIFDFDKLKSNKIIIDKARNDEKFTTLDSKERILSNDDIVIRNGEEVIALAGVMGGENTEVSENTNNILIELAHFDNISVRRTSRRHSLISESSYRFERAVDTENFDYVMNRLTDLIVEIAGGEVCDINDVYPVKKEKNICQLSLDRMNRFIGKVIPKEKVIEIFNKLEIKVVDKGDTLELTAPSFRGDLINQFDYFEEVIRMYGFDNIENKMPKITLSENRLNDTTKYTTDIKVLVSNLGLREVINYSFIPENSFEKLNMNIDFENIITLKNPIVEEFSVLRPTLMYSLLKNVKDNLNRGQEDIRFFEVSKRFVLSDDKIEKSVYINEKRVSERETLGIVLSGSFTKNLWAPKPESYDFFDMKGIVEAMFDKLNFKSYQLRRSVNSSYHPGRSVDLFVGKELIGTFGEIHPDVLENMEIDRNRVIYAEIYLDLLSKYINKGIKYKGLSKYQSVPRDIAVVVKEEVLVGDMIKSIQKVDKLIEKVELFDIYRGIGVKPGFKSVAISIVMRDDNKTLEEKDINSVMDKIVGKLKKEFDAELR